MLKHWDISEFTEKSKPRNGSLAVNYPREESCLELLKTHNMFFFDFRKPLFVSAGFFFNYLARQFYSHACFSWKIIICFGNF